PGRLNPALTWIAAGLALGASLAPFYSGGDGLLMGDSTTAKTVCLALIIAPFVAAVTVGKSRPANGLAVGGGLAAATFFGMVATGVFKNANEYAKAGAGAYLAAGAAVFGIVVVVDGLKSLGPARAKSGIAMLGIAGGVAVGI
ncbi:MAG TPA: hypothetical protein PLV68_21205, partial [Ilumatobacteraceae bacterium]|nr:hypothetical protein [Ilumatobacteraceae bacterium]